MVVCSERGRSDAEKCERTERNFIKRCFAANCRRARVLFTRKSFLREEGGIIISAERAKVLSLHARLCAGGVRRRVFAGDA